MNFGKVVMALLAGIFLLSVVPRVMGEDDVIEKRQKLMKSSDRAWRVLRKGAKEEEKDYDKIESKAKVIIGNMDKALDLFPKGSTSKESRAKAAIWENWDDFSEKNRRVTVAAQSLVDAAMAKDGPRVASEFKALNSACWQCHKSYRAQKKRK